MIAKPPPRLLDDPALDGELRDDLERVVATPYAYDAAAGLAALQAAVGASSTAAAGTQAAAVKAATTAKGAALLGSSGVKLGLAAAGIAIVATSALVWPKTPPPPHAPPPRSQLHTTPAPTPAPALPPAPAPALPLAPAPALPPAPAPALSPTHPTPHASPDTALQREVAELGRVKALLDRDPAAAYRLAESGHRRFASGVLHQEREGLAVVALFKLGNRAQATRRAHAFLATYPRSPLREQLERELSPLPQPGESE